MQQETLDSDSISNHKAELSISNGMSFDSRIMVAAVIGVLLALAMLLSGGPGYLFGPALLFGSSFVFTSSYGTDISLTTNYAREYNKRFGFKTGKWLPMAAYSDIVILKIGRSQKTSDFTGAVSTKIDVSKNEVYLMTHDHRKRLLLKVCNSYEDAIKFSEEISNKLDKKVAVFNPKLTQKTRERLQRRR